MSEVSPTVERSMGEAAAASAVLIERCVDHAVAALQAAEQHAGGVQQRQEIAEAWRELLAQRQGWTQRFPRLLARAFDRDAGGRARDDTPSNFAALSADALSLVGEDEISRNIETSRLTQVLTSALDRPLSELDALMSSALGLDGIRPERNPLRPEVYAQVLRNLMGEAAREPGWPALWLRHMAKPLALGLEQVYRDQAHLLTLARVQAASYRVSASRPAPLMPIPTTAPAQRPGAGAPATPAHPAAPGGQGAHGGTGGHAGGRPSAPAPLQAAASRQPLPLQEFLLRGAAYAQEAPAASYYAAVDAEMRALAASADSAPWDPQAARRHAHLPAVDRPQRHVGTDSPLPQDLWGRYSAPKARSLVRSKLKTQVRDVGQAYGLEIVRALVDQVAQDPRLLAPVREAIVGLEPSLLRLAMVAPRFFSDEVHPGRLLVERVAERSFKYNDEFSVDFQGFFMPVGQGFQRLNQIEQFADAEPFRHVLATLQAGWEAQDALDAEGERKVVAAVEFAEARQREADRIAGELRQREDLADVPQAVQDFVLGPWALVIAHARLKDGRAIDPGGYVAVVADLLWGVKRDLTLHEPARAFELIPRVLMRVRAGLEMLGQDPAESEAIFRTLEALHRPVLKLRARQRHRELLPPAVEPPAAPARPAATPDGLWLAQSERTAAGFVDADAAPVHAPSAPAAAGDEPDAETVLHRLVVGTWVDLFARPHWRRARLVWAAERGTLFMFVSNGGQPHSMTRRSIERLLRERALRLVEGDGVVPRALQELARAPAPALLAA